MAGAPVVLLVEDHPDTAEIVREVLEQAGYAVVTYDGGRGALDAVALHRPAVVVLDLRLPDLDGREVLRGLAGLPAGGPGVVVVTSSPELLSEADRALAGAVVDKPFALADLLRAITGARRPEPPAGGPTS
jgi:CheY-like chemotaxis protein